MDTEKKPDENNKQGMADAIGNLIVSGATVLAHSAAEAVVGRVKKAAQKTRPVKAVAKVVKKAKKSVSKKAKASKKSAPKKSTNKTAKKSIKKYVTKAKSTTKKVMPKKKKKAKSGRSRT